ncbi:MAG: DUF4038 domain-containing protein [Sphaerochaetaceae bacterium]|nr:DUF4038 domain-containing protein [Sphaerochaetaceae bacterium]MDC7249288.1 DUF4038 domain-containing protein [Sphaerochaetaceae bacterium]
MKNININELITIEQNQVIDIKIDNNLEIVEATTPSNKEFIFKTFKKNNINFLRFSGEEAGIYILKINDQEMKINVCKSFKYPTKLTVNKKSLFIETNNKNIFLSGYECNWLGMFTQRENNVDRLINFIATLKEYKFNFININVFAYDTTWCKGKIMEDDYGPAELFPWKGDNENPDFTQFNEEYFKAFDQVIQLLHENNLYVHLYFKVFNKEVNWPKKNSKEEKDFFNYIIHRYQAFSNIVWDYAKEAYYEDDFNYLVEFYQNIDKEDSYHRLKTLHDNKQFYEEEDKRNVLDFCTTQQHYDVYTVAIWQREKYQMPIYSSEFGYECGIQGIEDLSYMYGQSPEVFVTRAWQILFALSYPSYYYTYTAWDIIIPEHIPTGYKYWKLLSDYATEIEFWNYTTQPQLCYWRGRCLKHKNIAQYIYFIDENEHALFYVAEKYTSLEIEWFDIFTGKTYIENKTVEEIETIENPSQIVLDNPYKDQWAVAKVKIIN